jgi:hypothetical protein
MTQSSKKHKKKKEIQPPVVSSVVVDSTTCNNLNSTVETVDPSSDSNGNIVNDHIDETNRISETNSYRTGKYSAQEDCILEAELERVIQEKGWTLEEGLETLLNGQRKSKQISWRFWKKIAQCLPHRHWRSVWAHCRVRFNPRNYLGNWTPEEEQQLHELVKVRGHDWRFIGDQLGRLPGACKDKWRQIEKQDQWKEGTWTKEEESKLLQIIEEIYGGIPPRGTQISWTTVAKRLGTRNYTQCQTKWYSLNPYLEKDPSLWTEDDNKILILKLWKLRPNDESEIIISQLSKKWSYNIIHNRYKMLIRQVPDYRILSIPQILQELRKRYNLTNSNEVKALEEKCDINNW